MQHTTPAFDDFWTASELSALTRPQFVERMAAATAYESTSGSRATSGSGRIDPWARPGAPRPAEQLTGSFAEAVRARSSVRRFDDRPISDADLGRLLSVLSGPPSGRGYPSAGGLYPVRAIVLNFQADRAAGRLLQHDPDQHTLTELGGCPGWSELVEDLAGQDAETAPAAVIGLFADTDAMLAKYGERGGRFVLLEAGAMLQSLTLSAGELGLVGYPMGGAGDARMLHLAGLAGRSARFVINYAVGHPDRAG